MAILRVSTGKVYSTYQEINQILAPAGMTVGSFDYKDSLKEKVEAMDMELPASSLDLLFGEVAHAVASEVERLAFNAASKRAGAGVPIADGTLFTMAYEGQAAMSMEMKDADSAAYLTPHILRNNNLHFGLVNAFVKGVQLPDATQCVIYTTAGEWMNLTPDCLAWVVFAHGVPAVGLSYFDAVPDEQGQYEMDVRADHAVLETMKF
ncbi:MAG: hypothetical protein AAF542_01625 [Pseudomonadota bacterium]